MVHCLQSIKGCDNYSFNPLGVVVQISSIMYLINIKLWGNCIKSPPPPPPPPLTFGVVVCTLSFRFMYNSCLHQALGDGGQGWGNVFLYILSSPKIRERLFYCLCHPSWRNLTGLNRSERDGAALPDLLPSAGQHLGGRETCGSVNDTTSLLSTQ